MNLDIDLGRTWLRASLCDEAGRVQRHVRFPAVPWRQLAKAWPQLHRRLQFSRLDRLRVGATGLWSVADRAEARRLWRGWAKKIQALSDAELAHTLIFGSGPGLLIVASTGSIALARDRRGRWHRSGGWGPLLGDEGSGFWIGKSALKDPVLRRKLHLDPLGLAHAKDPVRAVAQLAPQVLRLARTDPRARRIRNEAARHLADLASEAGGNSHIPASCWGGLFQDIAFRRTVLRLLHRQLPQAEFRLQAES